MDNNESGEERGFTDLAMDASMEEEMNKCRYIRRSHAGVDAWSAHMAIQGTRDSRYPLKSWESLRGPRIVHINQNKTILELVFKLAFFVWQVYFL